MEGRGIDGPYFFPIMFVFSRGHATLHHAVSVRSSFRNIFELRAVFALQLLPNRPRLDRRVSGHVSRGHKTLYTLPCRSVPPSVTFFICERFSHYSSYPAVRDWIAVYPALFG